MNHEAIIRAAYRAVLAIDQEPTPQNVQAMAENICEKQLQASDVMAVLRDIKESLAE